MNGKDRVGQTNCNIVVILHDNFLKHFTCVPSSVKSKLILSPTLSTVLQRVGYTWY